MFGFSPFASSAFADINETNRVLIELTGVSAEAIDDGAGVAAGGSISVPVFEDPGTGEIGTVAVAAKNNVVLTGVEASGAVGTVLVRAASNTVTVGVSASGEIGTVVARAATNVPVTGLKAQGAVGTVATSANAVVTLTGVAGVAALGSVTVRIRKDVRVTGVEATGAVTAPTVVASSQVLLVGVQATGTVTTPLIWSVINDNQTPNWTQIKDGNRYEGSLGSAFGFGAFSEVSFASLGLDGIPEEQWTLVNDGNTVVWVEIPT